MVHRTGTDRSQLLLLSPSLDELIADDNPVKVIEMSHFQIFLFPTYLSSLPSHHSSLPSHTHLPGKNPVYFLSFFSMSFSNSYISSLNLAAWIKSNSLAAFSMFFLVFSMAFFN